MAISNTVLRFAILLCTTLTAALADGSTFLTMNSDPGDYIGQGVTRNILPGTNIFGLLGDTREMEVWIHGGSEDWTLLFDAPSGGQLTAGMTYNNVVVRGLETPTTAALDVSGDGRGCDNVTGSFTIEELTFDAKGNPATFAADFVQHCEGQPPRLVGTVRVGSSIGGGGNGSGGNQPPIANARSSGTVYAGQNATLDGTHSAVQGSGMLIGYSWVQTGGPSVSLANANTSQASFTAPSLPTDQTYTFQLTVTDTNNATATSSTSVTVKGTTAAETVFSFVSDGGDTIGGGQSLTITGGNTPFALTGDASHVHLDVGSNQGWSLDFAAPSGAMLQAGTTYAHATRYAPQPSAIASMNVAGNGNSCSTSTDSFTINELDIGASGQITGFSADFVQHCEGATPALHGTIIYSGAPYSFSATASGSKRALTLNANIKVAPADQGKAGQVFIAALAGNQLLFRTATGWVPAKGSHYPAYWSGPLFGSSINVLKNADTTPLAGATVYVGYGINAAEMVAAQRYRAIYTF